MQTPEQRKQQFIDWLCGKDVPFPHSLNDPPYIPDIEIRGVSYPFASMSDKEIEAILKSPKFGEKADHDYEQAKDNEESTI